MPTVDQHVDHTSNLMPAETHVDSVVNHFLERHSVSLSLWSALHDARMYTHILRYEWMYIQSSCIFIAQPELLKAEWSMQLQQCSSGQRNC